MSARIQLGQVSRESESCALRGLPRSPAVGKKAEHGTALMLALLVITALTAGAIGVMRVSTLALRAASAETSRRVTVSAADGALATGLAWYGGQSVLGTPPRTNALNITSASEEGYWNFRNYGGIASAPSSTVADWSGITPDMVFNAGTSLETEIWFSISRTGESTRVNRLLGQEAGRSRRHTLLMRGLARHSISVTRSELRVHASTLLPGYD